MSDHTKYEAAAAWLQAIDSVEAAEDARQEAYKAGTIAADKMHTAAKALKAALPRGSSIIVGTEVITHTPSNELMRSKFA